MEKGWVKSPRAFLDSESSHHAADYAVYFYCLLRANISKVNYRGIILEPGQLLTSVQQICDRLGLTEKQVRVSLERLKKGGQVVTKRASKGAKKGTVITVVNYGFSDGLKDEKGEKPGQIKGEQQDNSIRTRLENKEVVSEEGAEPSPAQQLAEAFRNLGLIYKGRGSLEGMFAKRLKEGCTVAQCYEALSRMRKEVDARGTKKDDAGYYLMCLDSVIMEDEQRA